MSKAATGAFARLPDERALFSGGPVVLIVWEAVADWPIAFVTQNVAVVMGYSQEEMMSPDFRYDDLIHPDDRERQAQEVADHLAAGDMFFEQYYRLRHQDGSWHWYYDYSMPVRDAEGRLAEIRGYLLDRSAQHELEERQRLLERGFESMSEGMMVTDDAGVIVAVNPAFTRITGYTAEDVVGTTPDILKSDRHSRDFYDAMWKRLMDEGEWSGEIWNRRKNGEVYPEVLKISSIRDGQGRTTHYIATLNDTTALRNAQENAEWLTGHDPLTELPNRLLFMDRLEQSLETARHNAHTGSVLVIDIVRFKDINDTRGIHFGDRVIQALTERIDKELREGETLSRLGGDEFTLLLPRLFSDRELAAHQALTLATRLQSVTGDPLLVDGESMTVEIAIGIALFPDGDLDEIADVMSRADLALVRAKSEAPRRIVLYESAMSEAVHRRFRLEKDLREAAVARQFRLYLQPQRDRLRRILGFEALVRWQHPQDGLLAPASFIPLAEETGLIGLIDDWMLAETCRLLARCEADGRPVTIAVNLSPWHFHQGDMVTAVRNHLAEAGARPERLMLEITENMMIRNQEEVAAQLRALAEIGVRFAIDDFGTGYSSLAWVQKLPIHEIKIDRSFVSAVPRDVNAAALVKTMLDMAEGLGLAVVAEGVEIEAQAEFLDEQAEILQQGYFHGRPAPAADWLAKLVRGEGLR